MGSLGKKPKFLHRFNSDGTIDTICRECFITVATRSREADLERPESDHICDPWVVEKFKEDRDHATHILSFHLRRTAGDS